MAVIKKTLFPKNLDNYSVLVNDTDVDSKYFKITSLPDTFTGGKNAFLIAGSEYLVPDTKIQIELKDASGNIIYHEPGEGLISSSVNGQSFIAEYYEGVSKVVSVYVYPDTAYGPCTLTILGELNSYNSDGITSIVPLDWENKYNVKWQRQINVDPSLANTTKIRFYQRPQVTITEILNPIYRIENNIKVNSGVSQSFANIKLSNLETFAGDVKRVKVFRTSDGDISDFDLIQDILVESKELLTSYDLVGSVVGNTGILTSETLQNYWNTGSLNAFLTSSRVEAGVRLTGSGYFTYTSSLDIKSANTYELNLDAFYSSSTSSNLGVYLSWVSQSIIGPITFSSSLATLNGTAPTKNLLDTIIPFKISTDYPTASLYFSQSQGEWHLGNISLKLSQDTAFSPDEITFVTTMPTVIGNETYNFKFEFYDVNNNFVPVAVTQSANFTGGTNTSSTTLLIAALSSSFSSSLTAVSSSISGTVTSNSSSTNIKINNVSSSISGSIYTLSGSIANELILTSGSILLLSGSFLQFTQSVSSSLNSLSQSVSSSIGTLSSSISSSFLNAASQSAFQVYSASQYLDKFIFTDENGKINQTPTASSPGLYLGSDHLGYFSGSSWKTYMDNQGDFYLTSSVPGGGLLAWSSQLGTLQVQGVINIQGGNAATTSSVTSAAANAALSGSNAATAVSNSLAPNIFTNENGLINRPPATLVSVASGLYLGPTFLGYYNGSDWKTYMQNNGNFFLSGAGSDSLSWSSGVLSINGAINITGGNAATDANALLYATRAATSASLSGSAALTAASNAANSASISASAVDDKVFTNALGRITKAPTPGSTAGLYLGSTNLGYYNGGTWRTYMDNTGLFYLTGSNNGNALLWDGSTLTIKGTIKVGDGTEVTTATITGATSGSTSLQSGNTGKSLGLTGGSIGGVTIASTKIYVGTGNWGQTDTGFYVDSTGQFSLKDKLTWNGTTLSVIGDIVITGGSTKTAIDNTYLSASAAQTTADTKITAGQVNANVTSISGGSITTGTVTANRIDVAGIITAGSIIVTGGAAGDVNSGVTKISGGQITANTITANEISSLNFTGKTATFDKGSIGGWDISNNAISKSVSGVGRMVLKSSDNTISMFDTSENLRLQLNPSTTLPTFASPNTTTTIDALAGVSTTTGTFPTAYITTGTGTAISISRQSNAVSVVLSGTLNEIFIDDLVDRWYDTTYDAETNIADYFFYKSAASAGAVINAKYVMTAVVSGASGTFSVILGYVKGDYDTVDDVWVNASIYTNPAVFSNLTAGTYSIYILHEFSAGRVLTNAIRWYPWSNSIGGTRPNSSTSSTITITYGTSTAYSVLNAGGVVFYNGSRNIFKISQPATTADSFFQVTGKSQFNTSLYVSGALAADSKQFQITHPLNDNKWLYHSAIESPGAYLIYKGTLELQNGVASASIDLLSKMTDGTFESLVRRTQFFVQNNSSWDLVRGRLSDGVVYIESNNNNSTASVDWMVVGERKDDSILNSVLYDNDGNYKPEKYKSSTFLKYVDYEIESGSI